MRIKLDENLPAVLADDLRQIGHEVDTVDEEKLSGALDTTVFAAAQKARRFVITQDLDFAVISRHYPSPHHGVMLVRLRAPSRRALRERVLVSFAANPCDNWEGKVVVVTDLKTRVTPAKATR